MRTNAFRLTTLAALLAVPMLIAAQGPARGAPRGPMGPDAPRRMAGPGVTQILNARRVLDLTPRQVAQLDSIERAVFAERRTVETRMRALRDSIRTQVESQGAPANDAERTQRREAMRTRLEALRPQMQQMRSRDSTAAAAAQRVLTDAQRQQLREIQAEQRGRAQGMREARMRGGRGGPVGREGMSDRGETRRRMMIERGSRRMMIERDTPPAPPARPDIDG